MKRADEHPQRGQEETTRAPLRRAAGACIGVAVAAVVIAAPWADPPRACASVDVHRNVIAWTVGDDAPTFTRYADRGDRLEYRSSVPPAAHVAIGLALEADERSACTG